MSAAHTPGPWRIVRGEIVAADGEAVGTVFRTEAWSTGEAVGYADQANARLIGAAPDLLAALLAAERFMAGFEGDEMQEGIDERLAAIRAALAKATRSGRRAAPANGGTTGV